MDQLLAIRTRLSPGLAGVLVQTAAAAHTDLEGGQRTWINMLSIEELFKGRHFDREIITLCVRWYLRFN